MLIKDFEKLWWSINFLDYLILRPRYYSYLSHLKPYNYVLYIPPIRKSMHPKLKHSYAHLHSEDK